VEAQDQVELVEECLVEKEHRGFDRSRTSSRFGFAVVFGCMGCRLYLFPVSQLITWHKCGTSEPGLHQNPKNIGFK
jgi:hypothetical protein